jgi:hemerythrin
MSEKIIWSSVYSVQVKEIDDLHKQFFTICNNLFDLANNPGCSRQEALIGIMKFGDYAAYHLGEEEEILIKAKHPDAFKHVQAHSQFREKINDYINQIREENRDIKIVMNETATFASDWLLHHILTMGEKYSQFFSETKII